MSEMAMAISCVVFFIGYATQSYEFINLCLRIKMLKDPLRGNNLKHKKENDMYCSLCDYILKLLF